MLCLKQSTAATIIVGPVLASDGTAYDSVVLADFDLAKNGTNTTLTGATVASIGNGRYTIALTTGNTDTLGRLAITCNKSTYAMSVFQFTILTSAMFDALITNGSFASLVIGVTGDLTSTMKSSVTTAATAATPTAASISGVVFPANFASLSIDGSGRVWLQATQTGVTIPTVTTVGTLTTYTGNTPQTGDAFARIGAFGAGLTALGDTRVANLDAAVSTRLATSGYTTPPTVSQIRSELDTNSTKLDVVVSDTAAIKAKTDNLPASPAATGGQMDLVNAPNATAVTAIQSGLATATNLAAVKTDTGSIVTKFGGITLLKNWLAMIMGSAADTATKAEINATTAGATYNNVTKSLQAQTGGGGGSDVTIENIITVPPAVAVASQVPGRITVVRGDTLRRALTTLGSVSTRTKAWFTAKRNLSDTDDNAMLQIIEGVGLVVYDREPATDATLASITIDDTTGVPTLVLSEELTAQFTLWRATWDVQIILAGDVSSPISGTMDVESDVTRAIN